MDTDRLLRLSVLALPVTLAPVVLRVLGVGGRVPLVAALVVHAAMVAGAATVRTRTAGWYVFELPDRRG